MPLRTDLVSGAECDRVAWPHHAATEAMGQGEARGTRRPGIHRKAAWTTPYGEVRELPDCAACRSALPRERLSNWHFAEEPAGSRKWDGGGVPVGFKNKGRG